MIVICLIVLILVDVIIPIVIPIQDYNNMFTNLDRSTQAEVDGNESPDSITQIKAQQASSGVSLPLEHLYHAHNLTVLLTF